MGMVSLQLAGLSWNLFYFVQTEALGGMAVNPWYDLT